MVYSREVLTGFVLDDFLAKGVLAEEVLAEDWLDFTTPNDETSDVGKVELNVVIHHQGSHESLQRRRFQIIIHVY
jgi:hypothetical protein